MSGVPMTAGRALAPHFVALVLGAALWVATSMLTGRREPWDASAYWAVAYPLAILASAVLGYIYPERAWRWPFAVFVAQFISMCVLNGELGNLWPLGLLLFAVLALPALLATTLAARLAGRSREGVS
jgi:hypothetical protein